MEKLLGNLEDGKWDWGMIIKMIAGGENVNRTETDCDPTAGSWLVTGTVKCQPETSNVKSFMLS